MPDQWTIRGPEYASCNCAAGCPCQFNSPTTHGFCEALRKILHGESTDQDGVIR